VLRPAQIHPHWPNLFQDKKWGVSQADSGGTRPLHSAGWRRYRSGNFIHGRSGSQGGSLLAW
jgi:hypothetical protein